MPYTLEEGQPADVIYIKKRFLGSLEREAMQQTLDERLASGHNKLIIDLSKADFMDSSGIGLIVKSAKQYRDAGGDVRLSAMQDRIKNLFLLTRLLGPVFSDYPNVEAAQASFEEDPTPAPDKVQDS